MIIELEKRRKQTKHKKILSYRKCKYCVKGMIKLENHYFVVPNVVGSGMSMISAC